MMSFKCKTTSQLDILNDACDTRQLHSFDITFIQNI